MKIKEILEATKGTLIIGNIENECGNFCRDTRVIKKGDTYVGIKGITFDGNKLWKEAIEKEASTIIIENIEFQKKELEEIKEKNIIKVNNTVEAIGNIARYKREKYGEDFPIIGITGSVGKTSTKDIIANVISQKYNTLKTQGNKNNEIGLPFTIFDLSNHEAAVIEMGMNHLGEISYLTKIAKPKIAVITNIGTSHIGNLGSRENILKAKLEILDGMEKKILVINNDNDLLHKFYLENKNNKDIEIHTYGIENESEIMAENIQIDENDSKFICNIDGESVEINVPVGGIHFIYNALCGVIVGKLLNLDSKQIKDGIETFKLTQKRMDIKKLKNDVIIINDSYNASFESMQASLKYLSGLKNERKIAVLGDMFELGEYSKELHQKVGEEVTKNNIDMLICTGKNAKYIVEIAKKSMDNNNIYYFETKEEIVQFIKNSCKKGDAILIKASNGMKFFQIAEKLTEEC